MAADHQRTPTLERALGVAGVLTLAVVLNAGPATATGLAPAPQLSITVDNGRTSTTVGESLTYTITVRNLGPTDVTGLLVNQSMPAGLTFVSADSAGAATGTGVGWTLDLKAAATATMHSTGTVTATPPDLLRLASVACAHIGPTTPPIVCASHSDQLPAGAVAQREIETSKAATSDQGINWWYAAGTALLLTAATLITVLALRSRRRRQPEPAGPTQNQSPSSGAHSAHASSKSARPYR